MSKLKQRIEQFHLLFLEQLSRKIDQRLYAIKGGCNLRFFFHSIRYSEDLDIDVKIIAQHTLANKVDKILQSKPLELALKAHSIKMCSFSQHKQTATTQRWKMQLENPESSLPTPTKIEFSKRGIIEETEFVSVDKSLLQLYQLPPMLLTHYTLQSAFKQKIQALISRSETQARDVFDIYLLLQKGAQVEKLDKKTCLALSEAKSNANRLTFTDFQGQVVAYLPSSHQAQYQSEDAWQHVLTTVTTTMTL